MKHLNYTSRRKFIATTGLLTAGTIMAGSTSPLLSPPISNKKLKVVLVGTGDRGISFWGKRLVDHYNNVLEFAGLCDINPGRVAFARKYIGVNCPVFTDFNKMISTTNPDLVIVSTVDSNHHEFIIKAMDMGMDVLTEKPLTTDEYKCQQILDAEARSGKNLIVGFNDRWKPFTAKIKELMIKKRIGSLKSVDFHWYLNTYHGASYFRRWHGLRQYSGTLLVHKATHHFDFMNWIIDSDPMEVFAYGSLEYYGHNGPFRGENCRGCPHKEQCRFFWDITNNDFYMNLYVANEKYDGYIRDNCLFRREINIYDKMSVQVKYANNVVLNYSLTAYAPYEGWRLGMNGSEGRLDSWKDIPWLADEMISQEDVHAIQMDQDSKSVPKDYDEIMIMDIFGEYERIKVPRVKGGHGGGDSRMQDKLFRYPNAPDPLDQAAGSRDGAMSILIGIAARKSIESGRPIRIAELTSLEPRKQRMIY